MPVRVFCDMCDSQLADDDRRFNLNLVENERAAATYSNRSQIQVQVNGQWVYVDPTAYLGIMCIKCAKMVVQFILENTAEVNR